jgi:hypothetical protein
MRVAGIQRLYVLKQRRWIPATSMPGRQINTKTDRHEVIGGVEMKKNRMIFLAAVLAMAGRADNVLASGGGSYQSSRDKEETIAFEDGSHTERLTHFRKQIQIPKAYGNLINITAAGNGTALWFESAAGQIRNVIVPDGVPVMIERRGELEK